MPPMNNGIGYASPSLLIHKAVYFLVFSISKIFETTPKLSNRDTHNHQNITDLRKRSNMAETGKSITAFVSLNELSEISRTCELCENHFSILELHGAPGYAVYPVRLLCGHIFCYDCARMWISHAKCPECDARFADHTRALDAIDEQIRQYRQYQVACFNARLQAGMIRSPPGYPTFAGQQAGPSRWWHEDDSAKTAVSEPKSTRSEADDEMSDGDSELSEFSKFDKIPPKCYIAAQTLLKITNSDVDDDATISDGLSAASKKPLGITNPDLDDDATISESLSTPPSETPSIEVTEPEGHAVGLERDMAANGILHADSDDTETYAITKSEQTVKEFRMALGMINKVSGTNYSSGDFPNLKLKYERKPRR